MIEGLLPHDGKEMESEVGATALLEWDSTGPALAFMLQ